MSPELQQAFDEILGAARSLTAAAEQIEMAAARIRNISHRLNNQTMILRDRIHREAEATPAASDEGEKK